jgi:diadenosine tetraphosphate (Ap4A) HIT family hydrolase
MESEQCPFCKIAVGKILLRSSTAIAFRDAFPIAEGHTLVIPRQHVTSIFDLSESDQAQLWQFVAQVRSTLSGQLSPAGFNIGINDGEAAGQTVPHSHVHIIPRYSGDVPDPRGGVRWIIPEKAVYWEVPS